MDDTSNINNRSYIGRRKQDRIYLAYLRKNIKHPLSRKLQRFITNRLFDGRVRVVSPLGAMFLLNTFDYVDQLILRQGTYEAQSIKLCNTLLKDGGNIIDVGANFGLYSINLAKNKKTKVIAIEPNPKIFLELDEHKKENNLQNVSLLNCAIGEKNILTGMNCPSMNNSGNCQVSTLENARFFQSVISLQTVIEYFNLNAIKLVKIDVEGYEIQVLKGINWGEIQPENILLEFIPNQMESHNSSSEECYNYLIDKGYKAYTVNGNEFNLLQKEIPESNIWFKKV